MSIANSSEALAEELGPVLLDRRVGQPDTVATMGVAVVCWIFAAALIGSGWSGANGGFSWILAFGALMGTLGLVIFGIGFRDYWSKRETRQFVHQRGLREVSRRGVTCIGFDEADELQYRLADHYNHGVYTGTVEDFGLRTSGAPGKHILYQLRRRKRDEPTPFPPIVDAIAARLAARFAEAIERGESVRWASKMTIHPDGLTLPPRPPGERPGLAMLWGEPPSRVGWDDIDNVELEQGICRIRLKGSMDPRLTVDAGEPDFHPGYRAVMEILRARAASRPAAPVRGLAHGEKIVVEYPNSTGVRLGLARAAFLVDPKAQKNARELRLGVALFPLAAAGLAFMAYFEGKIGSAALQTRLLLWALGAAAAFGAIEAWERLSRRRKVYRQGRLAQGRFESGQGPDPAYLHRVTVGPPGFSCRTSEGELQCPWSEVSRVLCDRGSILVCRAGDGVRPEGIGVFLPAHAFDDPHRARDAFERITEWHRAAHGATATP